MNRVFSLTVSAPTACVRRLSATEVRHKVSGLAKLKQDQMFFQKDDDVPVYIKRGISDQILFFTALGLSLVSLGKSLHTLYKLSSKK